MATTANRVQGGNGTHQEDWDSGGDFLDGGETVTFDTEIPVRTPAELDEVECFVYVEEIVGIPLFDAEPTVTDNNGKVRVSFTNNAIPGNSGRWEAKVELRHSAGR